MNQLCYFEIPADNPERAKKFYGELFGWQFDEQTMGSTPYWMINTGGGVPGGLMKRQQDGQLPLNYVQVESVDQSLAKAKSLGAQVLVGKTTVPAMGYFAMVQDPEQNNIGLWQDDENAK